MNRSPAPAPVATLVAEERRRSDAALAALRDRSTELSRLLAAVEDLDDPRLGRAARDGLRDAREALLEWLGQAHHCAAAWRERLALLVDVEAGLVELEGEVILGERAAAGLSRLEETNVACDRATLDLGARTLVLRIAERCVGLRAAVADPRSADATLETLHAALRATPRLEVG